MASRSLFDAARNCLLASTVEEKLRLSIETGEAWKKGQLALSDPLALDCIDQAGRPVRPELVHPSQLERRGLGSDRGRAAMIHAITHIEFNAINLAWDAVHRFRDLPADYYSDWIRVALDEVYHYQLLERRLQQLGYDYGDFTAHNGLWDLACRTAHDPLVRMALIPRMMEARGLDVTPGIMRRFEAVGDSDTVEALQVILREEIGHVAAGDRWFRYLCEQRGLDSESTYFALLEAYMGGETVRSPLHVEARLQAGFSQAEIDRLEHTSSQILG